MPFQTSKPEIVASRVLRRHGVFFLLLLLPLVSLVSVHVGLLTAFVFTFIVPGLIFHRFFSLKLHEIIVFVPVFSVLASTQLIYYLSRALGYSREIIFASFLVLAIGYGMLKSQKTSAYTFRDFLKTIWLNKALLLIFLLIFAISAVVLYRRCFTEASGLKMI